MTRKEPTFTIGIEEEYLLVDRESRALVVDPPKTLMKECEARLKGRVSPEFLLSQIEVGTSKCTTLKQAAEEIRQLRRCVADLGVAEPAKAVEFTVLADAIYTSVRLGGSPCSGLLWRWGYGLPSCFVGHQLFEGNN